MADYSSIRKLLNFIIAKLKSFFISKDVLSFLLFLILSAGLWFLNVLDKERETVMAVQVNYLNLPKNIRFEKELPQTIVVKIKDEGLNLLRYSRKSLKPIVINMAQTYNEKGRFELNSDEMLQLLKPVFQSNTKITDVSPVDIHTYYYKLYAKLLPVKFNVKVEPDAQYMLCGPITIHPQSLYCYGSKELLDKINFVETKDMRLSFVKNTIHKRIALKTVNELRLEDDSVMLNVPVEMFTEKKISLPLTALNCPDRLKIITFPALMDVTFNVGMSYFKYFKPSDIQLVIDYKEINNTPDERLKVKVNCNNLHISNIRVQPVEVEFILEKK